MNSLEIVPSLWVLLFGNSLTGNFSLIRIPLQVGDKAFKCCICSGIEFIGPIVIMSAMNLRIVLCLGMLVYILVVCIVRSNIPTCISHLGQMAGGGSRVRVLWGGHQGATCVLRRTKEYIPAVEKGFREICNKGAYMAV